VLADFIWGVRALFPPLLYMLFAVIVVRVAGVFWRAAVRFTPPLTRVVLSVRRRWYASIGNSIAAGDAPLAQWLLTVQVIALALAFWIFFPYINAFGSFLDVAPPAVLAMLGPASHMNLFYRATLSVLVLAMWLAWSAVLRRATPANPVDRITAIAGAGVILVALALLVAPFRLEAQRFDVAVYQGQQCTVMGQRHSDLQLFCATMNPRVRTVPAADPALELKGTQDVMFTSK